ncbi:MAG: hypothetical protein M3131_11170 [Actinomycetota bacterium]|nr:hypothetical protein [Actinomycetota bacterium]
MVLELREAVVGREGDGRERSAVELELAALLVELVLLRLPFGTSTKALTDPGGIGLERLAR